MESKKDTPETTSETISKPVPAMPTNFFSQLQTFGENGLWHISLQVDNGYFIISTMLCETKGEPRPAILFKGTAEDLDREYFTALAQPVRETQELFANNSAYRATLEQARLANAEKAEKSKSKSETPAALKVDNTAQKKKKYEDTLKIITDLSAQWLYQQAIEQLPSVEEFPEKSADIAKLRKELEWKSQQLFIK